MRDKVIQSDVNVTSDTYSSKQDGFLLSEVVAGNIILFMQL